LSLPSRMWAAEEFGLIECAARHYFMPSTKVLKKHSGTHSRQFLHQASSEGTLATDQR